MAPKKTEKGGKKSKANKPSWMSDELFELSTSMPRLVEFYTGDLGAGKGGKAAEPKPGAVASIALKLTRTQAALMIWQLVFPPSKAGKERREEGAKLALTEVRPSSPVPPPTTRPLIGDGSCGRDAPTAGLSSVRRGRSGGRPAVGASAARPRRVFLSVCRPRSRPAASKNDHPPPPAVTRSTLHADCPPTAISLRVMATGKPADMTPAAGILAAMTAENEAQRALMLDAKPSLLPHLLNSLTMDSASLTAGACALLRVLATHDDSRPRLARALRDWDWAPLAQALGLTAMTQLGGRNASYDAAATLEALCCAGDGGGGDAAAAAACSSVVGCGGLPLLVQVLSSRISHPLAKGAAVSVLNAVMRRAPLSTCEQVCEGLAGLEHIISVFAHPVVPLLHKANAADAAQAAQAGSRANDGAITAPSFTGDAAGWGAAASDDYLATLRGGFGSGPGLTASFGIDRAVYVNGNLVTSSSLYIPNIGQLSTTQAGALAAMAGTINVIQNGPGDRIDPSVLAQTNPATVVQNTLNNQRIQTLTTINTTVSSRSDKPRLRPVMSGPRPWRPSPTSPGCSRPLLEARVAAARWNARQTLINLSMSAGLVPTLTQYSVPDYVHMNNIPAHHFQRPAGLDPAMDGADGVSGGGGTLDPGPAGRTESHGPPSTRRSGRPDGPLASPTGPVASTG
ncbi:MAG: hypothetical protein WDW36_008304 [Sanguina aurantia]